MKTMACYGLNRNAVIDRNVRAPNMETCFSIHLEILIVAFYVCLYQNQLSEMQSPISFEES